MIYRDPYILLKFIIKIWIYENKQQMCMKYDCSALENVATVYHSSTRFHGSPCIFEMRITILIYPI